MGDPLFEISANHRTVKRSLLAITMDCAARDSTHEPNGGTMPLCGRTVIRTNSLDNSRKQRAHFSKADSSLAIRLFQKTLTDIIRSCDDDCHLIDDGDR